MISNLGLVVIVVIHTFQCLYFCILKVLYNIYILCSILSPLTSMLIAVLRVHKISFIEGQTLYTHKCTYREEDKEQSLEVAWEAVMGIKC